MMMNYPKMMKYPRMMKLKAGGSESQSSVLATALVLEDRLWLPASLKLWSQSPRT